MEAEKTVDPFEVVVDRLVDRLTPILQERLSTSQKNVHNQRRLTISEASEYTGISEQCLYIMCREKQIPHYRIGSARSQKTKILFRTDSLDTWMEEQEKQNYKPGG